MVPPVRPLAVITGIFLGTSVAIALGLGVVLFIYWLIGANEPALQREIPVLRASTTMFSGLTVVAAGAFYGQLVRKWWRWPLLALLLVLVFAAGAFYWP